MSRIINVQLLCVSDLKGALIGNHYTDIMYTVRVYVFRDKIDHNAKKKKWLIVI